MGENHCSHIAATPSIQVQLLELYGWAVVGKLLRQVWSGMAATCSAGSGIPVENDA